jgi:hypothetical protein
MGDLVFIPGEDFDPYDEDDCAAVRLAMQIDMADQARARARYADREEW